MRARAISANVALALTRSGRKCKDTSVIQKLIPQPCETSVGQRTATETLSKIIIALLDRRTRQQARLAREAGVSVRTLKRRMLELQEAGVPVEEEHDPPHVYWSVPRNWVPTKGKILPGEQLTELARIIARHPETDARQRLLEILLGVPAAATLPASGTPLRIADGTLRAIEDASTEKLALLVSYESTSRGEFSDRHISPHRVTYGEEIRIVATCHRDGRLKWFRGDRIRQAEFDEREPYRQAIRADVNEHIRQSFHGYLFRPRRAARGARFPATEFAGPVEAFSSISRPSRSTRPFRRRSSPAPLKRARRPEGPRTPEGQLVGHPKDGGDVVEAVARQADSDADDGSMDDVWPPGLGLQPGGADARASRDGKPQGRGEPRSCRARRRAPDERRWANPRRWRMRRTSPGCVPERLVDIGAQRGEPAHRLRGSAEMRSSKGLFASQFMAVTTPRATTESETMAERPTR